ncbi:MAG: hypothetical protein JXB48_10680 [Candidatus Latescibacteria bacterium]|nr:hypothetical protein [Candidatus Latescibacterota bacterium]
MNLSYNMMGRIYIVIALSATLSISCGIMTHSIKNNNLPVPPSNAYVAETVIQRAFQDIDRLDGNGMQVSFIVTGTDNVHKIAHILTPEYLLDRGFIISEKKDDIPEIRVSVDTLYVAFSDGLSDQNVKQIFRSAEARVSVLLFEKNNSRKVFNGYGKYQDSIPYSMLDTVGMDEPYVVKNSRFITIFKPVLYGITLTSLVWYLYSYRG